MTTKNMPFCNELQSHMRIASKDSKILKKEEKLGDYIEAMLARHTNCPCRFGKCLRDFIYVVERVCLCIRHLMAIVGVNVNVPTYPSFSLAFVTHMVRNRRIHDCETVQELEIIHLAELEERKRHQTPDLFFRGACSSSHQPDVW